MYRAVTSEALKRMVPIENEQAVTHLAENIRIDVLPPDHSDGRDMTLHVDGKDCTWDIRKREVDQSVSPVSAYGGVREAMVAEQRRIGKQGKIVMVGRDIGTVVFPEADLKIYLDASLEERARRRYVERKNRGEDVAYESVLADMKRRDEIDTTRAVAPLKQAIDAVYIDSTGMSIEQVVTSVLQSMNR